MSDLLNGVGAPWDSPWTVCPRGFPCAAGQGSARMTWAERQDFLEVQQSLNRTATFKGLEQTRSISTRKGHFGDVGCVKAIHRE